MSRLDSMIDMGMHWCKYSKHPQHKMSALVYDGPILLAGAANSLKTHPKAETYGNHLHAELALIMSAGVSHLYDSTVIVTRVKKSGALGTSKPCEVCWAALRNARVRYVIYYDGSEWRKERL